MPKQSKAGRVIVVGSSNTDLVIHCSKLPRPGETVLGGDLQIFGGGKGANQAVAAARAGAKVHFIGAFGDDEFGRARLAELKREGIECSGCVIKKGVPSGVALIAVQKGKGKQRAENQILVSPGANARLTPADVKRGMPKNLNDGDVVLLSLEIPIETVLASADSIRKQCLTIVLNAAPFPKGGLKTALLDVCSLIILNESELRSFLNTSTRPNKSMILGRMKRGSPCHLVVTEGAKGANYYYVYRDDSDAITEPFFKSDSGITWNVTGPTGEDKLGIMRVEPTKVTPVDTVGAGDCFSGCLTAYLSRNLWEYAGAVPFAVAAASLKVTRHGAQAGMPYRHEILKMLKRMKK